MLQHGAYTLLIDACYDRERFPTIEEAIDWTWAETEQEQEAVKVVLRKFFTLVDGQYVQDRITEELAAYREISETNKRIALEREEAKRARSVPKREQDVNEPAPNHKPLTNNHKPLTNKTVAKSAIAQPEGVTPQTWDDWLSLRKAKKAVVTTTVINGAMAEAEKAGLSLEEFLKVWCTRGSQGLEASWLKPHELKNSRPDDANKFAGAI